MPQNHRISLQEAIDMTTRYRNQKENILKPEFANQGILPVCETFDKAAFQELANETGSVSIRCYLGMDTANNIRLIFVGVNDKDEDILPTDSTTLAGFAIMEQGSRCPPTCPPVGPLNPQP